jgi:tripartite-type tricarboxylate transporter receptor subunit TctC
MIRSFLVAAAVLGANICHAYPDKPIKVLMPFPPGGTVDVVARLIFNEAAESLGKPFVMDYKAGAAGAIATEAAARSAADGYTVLVVTPNHTINPALRRKLPFNPETDFTAVSLMASVPELLVAHPSVPFDSMEGLVKYAKANPNKLSYSSAGTGTLPHVTMELLLHGIGAQVTHVPYKGAAPALTDLIGGVVHLKYDTYATAAQFISSGKLKVLATAGRTRLPLLPNVPTVAESGLPGYEGYLWIGVIGPRGMPKEAVGVLSSALQKAVRVPKVVARLQTDGTEIVGSTPEHLERLIAQELKLWPRVVRDSKIPVSD